MYVLPFHTKFKKPVMSYKPYERTSPRCAQDSSRCLPGWTTLKLLLLLLSVFHCWPIVVVVVIVDIVMVSVFKKIRWSGNRPCKNWKFFFIFSFCLSPPLFLRFSLKMQCWGKNEFIAERFPMVLLHKHFFKNTFLTFEPTTCRLWMSPYVWLVASED